MKWKSTKDHKPTCSLMGTSRDLLMYDGKNYHRGYASYNETNFSNDCSLVSPKYYSEETKQYIDCIEFLEIKTPKTATLGNIWSEIFKTQPPKSLSETTAFNEFNTDDPILTRSAKAIVLGMGIYEAAKREIIDTEL